jgi:hypothetical protein
MLSAGVPAANSQRGGSPLELEAAGRNLLQARHQEIAGDKNNSVSIEREGLRRPHLARVIGNGSASG